MLNAIAHGRIGRDAELRFIPSGEAVADIAIACNYGRKVDGEQPTQWIKATIWGKQAEALAPYLTKGKGIVAVLQDVNVQEYEGKEGKAYSLVGRVVSIEFSISQPRSDEESEAPAPAPRRAPAPAPAPARYTKPGSAAGHGTVGAGFDDSDMPF